MSYQKDLKTFKTIRHRSNLDHTQEIEVFTDTGDGDSKLNYDHRHIVKYTFRFKTFKSKLPYKVCLQETCFSNKGEGETNYTNRGNYTYIDGSDGKEELNKVKALYKEMVNELEQKVELKNINAGFYDIKVSSYGELLPDYILNSYKEILVHTN